MKIIKIASPALLLLGIVLLGASCGGGVNLNELDLDKEVASADIQAALSQTAADLGWDNTTVESAGDGYQVIEEIEDGTMTLGITKVSEADLAMFDEEMTRENFAEKFCEALPQTEEDRGGLEAKVINVGGVKACWARTYVKPFEDLKDCGDNKSVNLMLGNYFLQALATVNKEEGSCSVSDRKSAAEKLLNNFAEYLK